ncbi:cellulase family glycosylhydrolase, partial [Nostoc sp. CHAB 5834]|nr:cellulase family glycosylhydrolase [Nostoc sp. CHAB 5834]
MNLSRDNVVQIATIANKIAAASLFLVATVLFHHPAHAYQGMPTPKLHVTGRFLQDPNGKNIRLVGYMQPAASWFNGEGNNYPNPTDYTNPSNVAPALNHYKAVADILSNTAPRYGRPNGWYCSYVRFIGDGNVNPNFAPGWDVNGNLSNPAQFNGWMQNVLVPYINHCRSRGLYVVLCGNPSEVFPGGDATKNMTAQYRQNLITFWTALASHPGIKSADNVMFEICNEPVAIETSFGANNWGSGSNPYYQALANFMQPIVNAIRAQGADNVIWVPGLGWQGEYAGFATYPITGSNIGYAAHIYPAYGNVFNNASAVANLWNSNYKPAADRKPMMITEMFWSPNNGVGYQNLFNGSTSGFGNAIKSSIDNQGNVSYLIGMVGDLFANLNAGLANTTLSSLEGTQAAFNWFPTYAWAAPTAPVGPANGIYEISPVNNTNLAMDVFGASSANGARITQYPWLNGANQKFRLNPLGNNRYWLEPQHALGKCVDIINMNPNNGAGLQL